MMNAFFGLKHLGAGSCAQGHGAPLAPAPPPPGIPFDPDILQGAYAPPSPRP